MDSGMIRKIEKAKRYAQERDRIQISHLEITFQGANNPHVVRYENGKWQCDCNFFQLRGVCSHTMALEYIFEDCYLNLAEQG